jgi:NADPH:quinone reductase-like Zn-dependent oxidoreductase
VGRTSFAASLSVTKPIIGRIVVYGASSGDAVVSTHELVFTSPVQLKGLHIGALAAAVPAVYRSLITELQELVALGVYPPGRPQLHALADGPAVLRELGAGRTTGKHALDPWR